MTIEQSNAPAAARTVTIHAAATKIAAAHSGVAITGKLAHATPGTAPVVPGRREFFKYQDLLVGDATDGKMRAQVMSASRGMSKPTGWHYHVCESQFIYGLKGWVDLEFEDGRKIRLNAGESLLIPGGMKHNETATSDDFQILEVVTPGEIGTVPCDQPEIRG